MKITDLFFLGVVVLLVLSLFFLNKFLYILVSLAVLILTIVLVKMEERIRRKRINYLRRLVIKKDSKIDILDKELNDLKNKFKNIKRAVNKI